MTLKGWLVVIAAGGIALSIIPDWLAFTILGLGAVAWWNFYKRTGNAPDIKRGVEKFFTNGD